LEIRGFMGKALTREAKRVEAAESALAKVSERKTMTDEQIKYMVERFLGWRLPENFTPDEGISFKPAFNENT
jgi:hypothetical protein